MEGVRLTKATGTVKSTDIIANNRERLCDMAYTFISNPWYVAVRTRFYDSQIYQLPASATTQNINHDMGFPPHWKQPGIGSSISSVIKHDRRTIRRNKQS
ncbi:hypothetical protein GF319_11895 [Candidatus Bathyarchaeota archaeon]|nr:hypothetical protein [Candidatus Bathyarchaeota archaeon]